jgi:hypothetical protein
VHFNVWALGRAWQAPSRGEITVKNSSRLILFVLFVALALVAPLTASARPVFRAPYAPIQGPSFFAPDSEGVIATGPGSS